MYTNQRTIFSTIPPPPLLLYLSFLTVAAHEANLAHMITPSISLPICLPPEAARLDNWQQPLLLPLCLYPCQTFSLWLDFKVLFLYLGLVSDPLEDFY